MAYGNLKCRCARCGKWMKYGETEGESGIYSPHKSYTLCEPCFFDEDAQIEEAGTNNLPDTLAKYEENLRG